MSWSQIGSDINGEATGDNFGQSVALSSDGTILAVGAVLNDGGGANSGSVRVYKNTNNVWSQIGSDINGLAADDNFGHCVALSDDGTILAVGAPGADTNGVDSGSIRVFKNINNVWTLLGSAIAGATGEQGGWSISLNSDGTIVAFGSRFSDNGGKSDGGCWRAYKYNGTSWSQLGTTIGGENSGDQLGYSISLNDAGNICAIGSRLNDGSGSNAGSVRVYEYANNTWTKIGQDIDGETAGDLSGWSLSLDGTGTICAIGSINNDASGSNAGSVRVYQYTNSTWTKIGQDIDGEAGGDYSGYSVSLDSTGTILAIGAFYNDGNGTDSGSVRVYQYTNSTWTKISQDIDGQAAGDNSGSWVSLNSNGTILAIGSVNNDNSGVNAGNVRVYYYPPSQPNTPTISSVTVSQTTATINFITGSSNVSYPVTSYKYASSTNGITYSDYITSNWTTGTSFTIPNLTLGSTYYFKIIAYNGIDSNPSSASSGITVLNFAPSTPTILSAYGIDSAAVINFTPGTNNGSAAITNYAYSTDSVITQNSVFTLLPISSNTSPLTISGLINNQIYSFTLKAFNGLYSSESNTISNIEITKSQDPPVITSILGNGSGIATVTFTQLLKQNNSIQNYYYNYSYGSYNSGWVLLDPPQTSSPLTIETSTSLPNLNFTLRSFNGYDSKNSNTISNVPINFDAPPVPVITSIMFINNKIRISINPQTISPAIIKYVYSTSQFINGRTVFSDFDNTPGVNEFTFTGSTNDVIYITIKAFNGAFSLPSKTNEYKILSNTVSSGTNNTIFISTRRTTGLKSWLGGTTIRDHISYSINNKLTWTPIQRWPFVIGNSSNDTLTVKFSSDILLYASNFKNINQSDKILLNILPINTNTTNDFFVINGNNISIDGDNNDVLIDSPPDISPQTNFTLFHGLIQNGTEFSNGYDNITIKNINIKNYSSINKLKEGEGLLCKSYFGKATTNNLITNCDIYKHSNLNWRGKISKNSGGISGQYTGINSTNFIISNCGIENDIDTVLNGENAGGIVGANSGTLSDLLITNCIYTGSILGKGSGGIIGAMSSNIKITNCSTSGEICSGGIAGTLTGVVTSLNDGLVEITDCNTSGNIISIDGNNYPGGIVSDYACTVKITRCYSKGQIGDTSKNSSGGIIGSFAGSNNGSVLIDRCFSLGNISDNCGGIAADNFGVYSGKIHAIRLSYSIGSIGNNAGGIVGPNIAPNYPNYLNYNFITSSSNPVFNGLGYGYGSSTGSSNRNAFINILGCFSYGSLANAYSGGIIARTTQTYPAFLTDNKFFLRMLTIHGCAIYGTPITTNVIQNLYQNFVTLDYENIYNNNSIIGGDSTLPPVQGIFNKTITEYDGDLLTDASNLILDPLTSSLNNSDIKPRINTGYYIGLNDLPSSIPLSTLLLLAYPINQLVSSNKTILYNLLNNTNVTPSVLTSSYGGYTIRTIVDNSITNLPLLFTKFNMTYSDLISQGILPADFYTAGIYSISWFRDTLGYKITDYVSGGFNLLSLFPTYTIYDFFNQGHSVNLFRNNNISAFDVRWINGITPYHFQGSLYNGAALADAWYRKQDGTKLANYGEENSLKYYYYRLFWNELNIRLNDSPFHGNLWPIYQLPSNFTYSDLVGTGFLVRDLIGFRDFSKNKILSVNYYSVAQLREGGFTASDLKTAGYTNAQMISGGFTTEQVNAAEIQTRQPAPHITRIETYPGYIKVFFRQRETNCSAPIISYYYSLDGTNYTLLKQPFQTTSPLTIPIPITSGSIIVNNLYIGSFNGLPSAVPNQLVRAEPIPFNSRNTIIQSVVEGLNITGANLNPDVLPNAGITSVALPGMPLYLGLGANTILGSGFGYGMNVLPGSDSNFGAEPTLQGSDEHIARNIATQLVVIAISQIPFVGVGLTIANRIMQWQNYQDQQQWERDDRKQLVPTSLTIDPLDRNMTITNVTYTDPGVGSVGYELKIYFTVTGSGDINGYQYRITNSNYSGEWTYVTGIKLPGNNSTGRVTSPLIVTNLLFDTSVVNNIEIKAYNIQPTLYNGIYSKLVDRPNTYGEFGYPVERIAFSYSSTPYQLQVSIPNMPPHIKMNSITPTLPEIYPSLTEPNVLYVSFEQKDYNAGGIITKYACSVNKGKTYLYSDTLQSPQIVPYNLQNPIVFRGLPAGKNMDARFKSWNGKLSNNSSSIKVTVYGAPAAPVITRVTVDYPANSSFAWPRISFTQPSYTGDPITIYEYSTDNGISWSNINTSKGRTGTIIFPSMAYGATALQRGTTVNLRIRASNELPVGQLPPSISTPNNIYNQQNIKLRDQGFRFGFKSQQSNLWTITL